MKRILVALAGTGMALLSLGCCPDNPGAGGGVAPSAVPDSHADEHDHDHASLGPHGGHVIVLGDEQYHAELVHDEAAGTVGIYLLDSAVENPIAEGPDRITLQVFREGKFIDYVLEASGERGNFSVADAGLCDLLSHAEQVKGRLRATIGGQEFVGVIEHEAHDHSGHDHGDEDLDGHVHSDDGGHAHSEEHDHGEADDAEAGHVEHDHGAEDHGAEDHGDEDHEH